MLGLAIGLGRGARLLQKSTGVSSFVSDHLQLWYQPEDRSTLSGSTPAITGITDKSGNGNNGTLTSNWAQMTHAQKGNHMLRANFAAGSKLDTGTGVFGNSSLFADSSDAFTIFVAGKFNGNGTILSKTSSTFGNAQLFVGYSGGTISCEIRDSAAFNIVTGVSDTLVVFYLHWDGATFSFGSMKDGESTWTTGTGVVGTDAAEPGENLLFGSLNDGANYQVAGEYGEMMVYDSALDANQLAIMQSYFANNWTDKQFDARIVLFGDSITNGLFNAHSSGNDLVRKLGIYGGCYAEIYNEAVNGWKSSDVYDNIDTIVAGYSAENYPTYFVGHIGTNNCSITRPYHNPRNTVENNITNFPLHLDYIKSVIEGAGYIMWLGQMPYYDRPFPEPGDGSTGVYLGKNMQYMNARPYNENIIEPWIAENLPQFCHDDDTPYLQWYDYSYEHETTLAAGGGGGIHPGNNGYLLHGDYFGEVVGTYIKSGAAPTKLTRAAEDDYTGLKFVVCLGGVTDPGGTNIFFPGTLTTSGGSLEELPLVAYTGGGNASPIELDYSAFDAHNTSTFSTSGDTSDTLTNSDLQDAYMRVGGDCGEINITLDRLPPDVDVNVGIVGAQTTGTFGEQVFNTVTVQEGQVYEATIEHDIRAVPASPDYLLTTTNPDGTVSIKTQDNSVRNVTSLCGISIEVL